MQPFNLTTCAISALVALSFATLAGAQNHVADGGFEFPEVGTTSDQFSNGQAGAWLVSLQSGNVGIYPVDVVPGANVTEGDQAIDLGLAGIPNGNVISQQIPTVAGRMYRLTFDWGAEFDWGVDAVVRIAGTTTALQGAPSSLTSCPQQDWITQSTSFEFMALGNDILEFQDMSDSSDPGPCTAGAGLTVDNISVVPLAAQDLGNPVCSPAISNSSGLPAIMSGFGSAQVIDNDLTLFASQFPRGTTVLFLASQASGLVANPGGSQGNLCLSGGIGRFASNMIATGFTDRAFLPVDLGNLPTPSGPISANPGETWYFQAWYRDVNPTNTSNFTDAIEVLLM